MAKKTISRRDFLCGAAAGAVVGAAATGLLTGFGSDQAASASTAAGAYKPGTYSATAATLMTLRTSRGNRLKRRGSTIHSHSMMVAPIT